MAEDSTRHVYAVAKRLRNMGLGLEPTPSGRSVSASLPLGPEPFPMPGGPRWIATARFFTVGHDRIKFLAPRAFTYLPLLSIRGCRSSAEIEAQLRGIWQEWMENLARSQSWLEKLGAVVEVGNDCPLCFFPLSLDAPEARVAVLAPARVILPSPGFSPCGPPQDLAERVYTPPAAQSIAELSFHLSVRLERLARSRRGPASRSAHAPQPPAALRRVPLLLVGVRFTSRPAFAAALTAVGCACHAVRSISEARAVFRQRTFEGVLVDAQLDRADGTELIPALRSLPGILELPIAIYDDRHRPTRHRAAKRAGAAAYLAGPLDAGRLAPMLRHIVSTPRRRFRRYPAALAVSWSGCERPATTAMVSRAGFSLRIGHHLVDGPYTIHVPVSPRGPFRAHVEVEFASAVSQGGGSGAPRLGGHFLAFHQGTESLWIAYLEHLHEHRLEHLHERREPTTSQSGA